MPFHVERYPKDWKAISLRIRERAGQRCECRGECGHQHAGQACGAPNGAMIKRGEFNKADWVPHHGCSLCLGGDRECRPVKVILTVAHLNHDAMDCRDENLRAWCQFCHLAYDHDLHVANARRTRRAKLAARDLFEKE